MAVTKIRGGQTRAADKYDPKGDSLATDGEVEIRVKQHSSMFHNSRSDVTKLTFDPVTKFLTDIKTFNNNNEEILLAHSEFGITGGMLVSIDKKVYAENGSSLYLHISKTYEYDAEDILTSINTVKIL